MQGKRFAAIEIGSYEVEMKIFQISQRTGIKEIDVLRHRMELGKDAFNTGKISAPLVEELGRILLDFKEKMKEYEIIDYRACATSAVREAKNRQIILDQIQQRTGIEIEVFSNSEQRFFGYKAIAAKEADFNKIIQKGTAIVDVGGGSIQVSVFDRDSLVTTQNMKLGSLRIREKLGEINYKTTHLSDILEELLSPEIHNLKKLYLKDRVIKNIILIGDFLPYLIRNANAGISNNTILASDFIQEYEQLKKKTQAELAEILAIPSELASLVLPSLAIYKKLIEETGAELVWNPGIDMTDGLVYEYAVKGKLVKQKHNFENDILEAAKNIGKRYMSNKSHATHLLQLTSQIFDSMKKLHGLTKRDGLLLQIAVLLHDCGKYISLSDVAECSYSIIMATEIIGLSHEEREIIANVVKYNTKEFHYYDKMAVSPSIYQDSYLKIAKLTAILRLANGLDRSHRQKFKNMKVVLKGNQLILTIETITDISLESGIFSDKAAFFEEVYGIMPVIRLKKKIEEI